jgi:two-component system, LytTR family, sensor kinase
MLISFAKCACVASVDFNAMTEMPVDTRPIRWFWIAALWCAGGLFDASQTVLVMRAEGRHQSWPPLFATELAIWLPWAFATPLVIELARRYPINRRVSVRTAAVHLAALITLSIVSEAWSALLQVLFNPWGNRQWPRFSDTLSTALIFQALTLLIAYTLILTATYLIDARERIARQAAETAQLNEALSKAQLTALRGQMEPHFMYNTLNSIAGLVRDQHGDQAVSMIVGLSEFLRRASQDSLRSQVTLAEEVDYLQRYLAIQKIRFGDRLQVAVNVPRNLLTAQVPSLLLQPLAENAIKHGIAKRAAGGTVQITAASSSGSLRLTVYNDSPHLPANWEATPMGVGMGNLRTRLQILYGNASELQMGRSDAGGVEVAVTLPLREA